MRVPHKNSPAGRHFDWSSLGLPDPNSPIGQHFDWEGAFGVPNPNSPAGRYFDYASLHHEWGNTLLDAFMKLPRSGKSSLVWIASEIGKRISGTDVTIQAALFRHYVQGTAEPYDLNTVGNIPEKWQVWIANATQARPGTYHITGEQAQKANLDDLSDALGHFTVVVSEKTGSSSARIYEIKKEGREQYKFGWGKGIHQGCRVPLNDRGARWLHSRFMPTRMYDYGHLRYAEQFKIQLERVPGTERQVWVAYIPWYVAVRIGKPFNVYGRFQR